MRPPPRCAQLLAALVRLVLVSDTMQAELNTRVEALAALRQGGLGPGDEDSDGEGGPLAALPADSLQPGAGGSGSRAGSEAPAGSAGAGSLVTAKSGEVGGAPATAADWEAWLQQQRLGVRRPLGLDLHGRRYW